MVDFGNKLLKKNIFYLTRYIMEYGVNYMFLNENDNFNWYLCDENAKMKHLLFKHFITRVIIPCE